jgi:SnoaL-like polyketide cyclase
MLYAHDARKVLQNLPVRLPVAVRNLLTKEDIRWKTMRKETVIWLQAVNGDPVTGRKLTDINAELFADEDEDEDEDDDFLSGQNTPHGRARVPKPDVTIDDPTPVGMPRVYLDGLSDVEFALTSAEARHYRSATRWEVRGKHTGTLLGVPGTGKAVTITGVTLLRFVEAPSDEVGKEAFRASEEWTCWDLPSLLEQLRGTP